MLDYMFWLISIFLVCLGVRIILSFLYANEKANVVFSNTDNQNTLEQFFNLTKTNLLKLKLYLCLAVGVVALLVVCILYFQFNSLYLEFLIAVLFGMTSFYCFHPVLVSWDFGCK